MTAFPIAKKHDIIHLLRANESIIRAFGVRRIGLFGSYQRDEARADSDVDLLVEFQPGETTFDHFIDPPCVRIVIR
uniref:Nucleotidyltransferase domain-containing protein n=1 Tax=Candidatus Kentrum sp. LPFa TaxID=2126335 RepID=A0A450Y2G3_9GAMM|nr:MAG: Nucleotidyltransferase domain-containing protein [Candidatus Kentron sp. LPFa]VFK35720.1 MAG: Nucleotidyltransferase domain-containing protein [Candidatus Kentron sp. LPFa]